MEVIALTSNESEFRYRKFEIVRAACSAPDEVTGRIGGILARYSQDEDDTQPHYTVFLYDLEHCWEFAESELESTGAMDSRETFYDGSSLRVRVDAVTGEGTVIAFHEAD